MMGGGDGGPLVPTRFVWPHGGRHVHLCGSFTRWRESLPMAPVEGVANVFAVVCSLPPGYHQYKFIVDSEWRHDERQAYMPDPLGNVNNWLLVRDPEPQPLAAPASAPSTARSMAADSQPLLPSVISEAPQTQQVPGGAGASMEVDPIEVPQPVHASLPPLQLPLVQESPSHSQPQQRQHSQLLQAQAPSAALASPVRMLPEASEAVSAADAEASRQRITDFLSTHYAHELLPESGKVVALDITLPVKQAFHALYEQGVPAAPLWDSERCDFVGMLSASDFITIIQQLRSSGAQLSEEELETHTIAAWKEAKQVLARSTDAPHTPSRRPLIHIGPDDTLRRVTELLLQHGIASVPVLHHAAATGSPPQLLHLASLSGILKCVARHFRHVAGSLPLLSQPLGALPLGTWAPGTGKTGSGRKSLSTLRPNAPLTAALSVLLTEGVSSMPVVDESGALLDVYARSDITALARERAYARLQLDDITIAEALRYRQDASVNSSAGPASRCHMCLQTDTLRSAIDRLALPGVRRLICVEAGSRRVEGVVSLTDVFQFLLVA